MGFSRKRVRKDGSVRYMALYRDIRGSVRSAGTYRTEKQANKAWQRSEAKIAEGRVGDPRRGRQSFDKYVDKWLVDHAVEPSTMEAYTYQIDKHLRPWFGPMKMVEILPEHVREWVTDMRDSLDSRTKKPLSAKTIKNVFATLSAVFTTALNDQVIFMHPCRGVKTPTVMTKPLTVITPEQFNTIYEALGDTDAQLLVESKIETGLRWGELTELRVKDLAVPTRILTVSRAVVELNPKFHPSGGRFHVKPPKDREFRRLKLSHQIAAKLARHISEQSLGPDDLLFAIRESSVRRPHLRQVPDPAVLGLTEPNEHGRQYRHGTASGYGAGKCRCRHCKDAVAIYRAKRRAAGKDNPRRPRVRDTDGHIPNDWFRKRIWQPAVKRAGIGFPIRIHELRHAHASWLQMGRIAFDASFCSLREGRLPGVPGHERLSDHVANLARHAC